MEGKFFKGSVSGFPLRGRLINFGSGDAGKTLSAATKVAKGALVVGGGLAVASGIINLFKFGGSLLTAAFESYESEEEKKERIRREEEIARELAKQRSRQALEKFKNGLPEMLTIDLLCMAKTEDQLFYGICASDNLDIFCEHEPFSIPIKLIKLITQIENRGTLLNAVVLLDGSTFVVNDYLDELPTLNFWTVAGLHKIPLGSDLQFVSGMMPKDKEQLAQNLRTFMAQKEDDIISLLGEEGLMKILTECGINPVPRRLAGLTPAANCEKQKAEPPHEGESPATATEKTPLADSDSTSRKEETAVPDTQPSEQLKRAAIYAKLDEVDRQKLMTNFERAEETVPSEKAMLLETERLIKKVKFHIKELEFRIRRLSNEFKFDRKTLKSNKNIVKIFKNNKEQYEENLLELETNAKDLRLQLSKWAEYKKIIFTSDADGLDSLGEELRRATLVQ